MTTITKDDGPDLGDYESLPESSTVQCHMVAGAFAGIMEHCLMYPVDFVKVFFHWQ